MTRVHVTEKNNVRRILLERTVGRVERAARKLKTPYLLVHLLAVQAASVRHVGARMPG